MLMPELWAACPQSKLGQPYGSSCKRLMTVGLLLLLGISPAIGSAATNPEIQLKQSVSEVQSNDDGTFSLQVTLTVKNVGNEELVRLRLKDDLDIFGAGHVVEVGNARVLAGNLTLNPGYDGLDDIKLLKGNDKLKPGSRAKLRFDLTFDPAGESGPFTNRAVAWSKGKHSGKAADDQAKFTFGLPLEPEASFNKSVGDVKFNPDSTYTATIYLDVTNIGNEELIRIQLKDDLDIFGSGEVVEVSEPQVLIGALTLNPNFDGLSDIRLLTGRDTLVPGERARLRFEVTFDPGTEPGPFINRALVWTKGRNSGIGVDVWDRAKIHLPLNPGIGLVKIAGAVTDNGDDSRSVPITLRVTNTGNEVLTSLQLEDPLDIFGSGRLIAIENIASSELSLNPNFNGLSDTLLLSGSDTLALATAATVTFTLRFDPGAEPGPFLNFATTHAIGELTGTPVSDVDDAPFLASPTGSVPGIDLIKTAGVVTDNGDDSLSVPVTLTVTNTGNEALTTLQLEDPLNIFGSGQLLAVENVASSELSLNPNFNGLTDTLLLSGSDTLALATAATVTFTLRFDPGIEPGPFLNLATTHAFGETSGTPVSDTDDAPFLASPTGALTGIDLIMTAGAVTDNGDDSLSVPITLRVTNTGNEALTTLQLEDQLNIFGSGQLLAVENVASSDLSLNPNFNGLTDTLLLDGSDTLALATVATVTFTLRFIPGAEPGPFLNVATTHAIGETSGIPVSDSDSVSFLAVQTRSVAAIGLVKTAGAVTDNGDDSLSVPITLRVTNTGNEALTTLQLEDPLNIFGSGQLLAVENVASPGLSLNPNFNGLTDTLLLDGSDTLALATAATVTFTLRFDPGTEPGPFLNTATTTATGGVTGTPVSDVDDAPFLASPTRTVPGIGLVNTAGTVTDNGDDSLSVPITLRVTNTGSEVLTALQLEDPLNIFGSGQLLAVENVASSDLSLNPNFNGLTDTLLLDGSDTLALATAGTVTFTLRFDPGTEPGPFLNLATTHAIGELTGTPVSDSDGATFLASPTGTVPDIRLVKTAGAVTDNGDNSLSVPITMTVTNIGNEALATLQLEDRLNIFGSGQLLAVENIASSELSLNPNFNGLTDALLLDGSDTLALAAAATVTFTLRFDPGTEPGPFLNTATITAIGELTGAPVSNSADASIAVSVPPPPPPPPRAPVIAVTKVADRSQVVRGGIVGYDLTISNLTGDTIANVVISDSPPAGFRFVENSALLIRSGPDGLLDTTDDDINFIETTGIILVEFDPFELGPNERVLVRYLMRVGTGVADGEYVNRVTVTPSPEQPVGSSAPVNVVGDPIFEKTTVIGKVFHDIDGNGRQDSKEDSKETGIPGVRLATVSGLTMETDAQGRYHIADVDVDRFERGANFIIKLDKATLPDGADVTTENPRVIRLTQATMTKVNFGVSLSTPTLTPAACPDTGAVDESGTDCSEDSPHTKPTATARRIIVSGGDFGCSTLVAETLPGRQADGQPDVDSEVTVFAPGISGDLEDGKSCVEIIGQRPGFELGKIIDIGADIQVGRYPLELTTEQGSRLRITNAGDIIRMDDPTNAEHIIVTPFRDDTDNTVISALRVANDGIEPSPALPIQSRSDDESAEAVATVDPFVKDPRLDVLALNEAVINDKGELAGAIKFAVYTNYRAYIKSFVLKIYGSSEHGFRKTLLDTKRFTKYEFEKPVIFNGIVDGKATDLSPFTDIEYVLQASDCLSLEAVDPFDQRQCHVDTTTSRWLALRAGNGNAMDLHDKNELWGKSNLAEQNIPVDGGRLRISGLADPDRTEVSINGMRVPVGHAAPKKGDVENSTPANPEKRPYVLEEYLKRGELEWPRQDEVAAISFVSLSADAHDITVDGGLFGCGQVFIEFLPGRSKDDPPGPIPAVTVVADPEGKGARAIDCPDGIRAGEYPIQIQTFEGTLIHVAAAGDVQPLLPPNDEKYRQQIVVTPFRDHTDSTVVSALRIKNEGFAPIAEGTISRQSPDPVVDDDFFIVALASLTIGKNDLSGNVLPLAADDHFDGSVYTDGRIAMYAKGKIQGKYLITAQLDSTEDELRNLGDNLKRKDPRQIFRQLDPDRYYPVYGDDSVTTTDVDTQGAFYVRVEWNKNTALWGNFNTGMTDTEFMQYNRSLYGAKFEHHSQETTGLGDAKSRLTVFGSEAQSVAAHVTFQGTGGSLYYLRNIDIVQGSEKVWIEVRRRDTQQVVEREILLEGRDYEIDAIQGRMILRRPLSQVVNQRGNPIIRSAPLEGDEVFLLVDYEYVPAAFTADDLTYGGRGQVWLGDHVAVGATSVKDERNGADYTLQGVDLTLKRSKGTYLRTEVASSEARQNDANFVSLDGGLTFQSQTSAGPGDNLDGDAVAIEGRIDLAEFSNRLQGDIRAWWKDRDADFSTGRLGQGFAVNDTGIELHAKIGKDVEISASHTDFEREQLSRERVSRVQADATFGANDRLQAGLEIRHEEVEVLAAGIGVLVSNLNGAMGDGEALLIGGRVGYEISDDTTVYAAAQTVADDRGVYEENDLITLGVNTSLSRGLAVNFEASDGDRGSAVIAGVDLATENGLNFNVSGGVGSGAISQFSTRYTIADGHELYGSYAVDPDRTDGARNLLTLGQRRSLGNNLEIFTESQFGKDDRYANVAHVFGLNFDGTEDWRYSASAQFSENNSQGIMFDRRALSLGAYRDSGDLKLSSRLEYREDQGRGVHSRQYVSSNSFTKIIDENSRWLGQLNLSWTDDELNGGRNARFVEFDIGHAYRPVKSDVLNIIAKYSFLYDLPTEGQATIRPDERSHLLSIEGIYDLNDRWEIAAKVAARKGDRRIQRDTGPWQEFGLRMASARARYQINKKWDGLAEYRWLSDITGDSNRHGALLALYYQATEHFKVGVGFNFTDFNDTLRIDSYENRGAFIDFVGKY